MCNCGNNGCGGCGGVSLPAGPAGPNGLNAFTFTTASFVQPTLATAAITIQVSGLGQYTGLWATVGQWIFIEGAGTFVVTARTPTSITIDVPNAAIEALNNAIRTLGQTVIAGKAVSPSGVQGVQGIPGAPGTNGTNATELIAYRINPLVVVPTGASTYTDLLSSAVTIPANSWSANNDVVKLVFIAMGTVGSGSPNFSIHCQYSFRIVINGVPIETTNFAAVMGIIGRNAMLMEVDLIGTMNGGFVDVYLHKQQQAVGGGKFGTEFDFTAGSAYQFQQNSSGGSVVSNTSSGLFSGSIGSINPTINNTLKIDGAYFLIGGGGTNLKELTVPYLRVSVHKAP